MSTATGAGGLPFDPSTLPLEVQMEIGTKMALGANPVMHFAPFLLGMWLDSFFLGCLIILFAKWKRYAYQTERPIIKILTCYLLVVSIGISCYNLAYQMFLFVSGFGVYKNFINPNWSRVFYTINTLSRMPAAGFFVHRAWMLSNRSVCIPIILIPLLLSSLACAIAATVTSTNLPINAREHAFVIAFLSTELTADIINTVTIGIGLYRSRTGWKMTDRLISRLIIISAETQLPPTIAAIGFLVCSIGWPNTTGIAIFAAAPKIHVICLVVVLNSRIKMKTDYSSHDAENSYSMKSKPTVTIDTYTHTDAEEDKAFSANHHQVDEAGVMRTVNGGSVEQDRRSFYKESDSKSSLV